MRIVACFVERHFPYNCLDFSDEDNSVSRTDNFVNVINSVTSREFSYCCVLNYLYCTCTGPKNPGSFGIYFCTFAL